MKDLDDAFGVCPECSHLVEERAYDSDFTRDRPHAPGDVGVCEECHTIVRRGENPGMLGRLDPAQAKNLSMERVAALVARAIALRQAADERMTSELMRLIFIWSTSVWRTEDGEVMLMTLPEPGVPVDGPLSAWVGKMAETPIARSMLSFLVEKTKGRAPARLVVELLRRAPHERVMQRPRPAPPS